MVLINSQKAKALQASLNIKKKHQKRRFTVFLAAVAAAISASHITHSLFPTPMNTSVLTGMGWLRELLTGHPVCFCDAFGMPSRAGSVISTL